MKTYIVTCTYQDFYRPPDHLTVDARDVQEAIEYAQEVYPEATSVTCERMLIRVRKPTLWTLIKRWFA